MSSINNSPPRTRDSLSKFGQFEFFSAAIDGHFQHQEQPHLVQDTQDVFYQDPDQQQDYFSDIDIDLLLLPLDFSTSFNGQDYDNLSNILGDRRSNCLNQSYNQEHIQHYSSNSIIANIAIPTSVSNQLNEPDLLCELDS
jgi:hypothetical protein